MSSDLDEYRQHLVMTEQKAQEAYDKTVLTLSGGALGVSFAFLDKFVTSESVCCALFLVLAWTSWGASVTAVLASHFCGQRAVRRAIEQVDRREIYIRRPGGTFAFLTDCLNVAGGVLFLAGVIFLIVFVYWNLGAIGRDQ